MKLDKKTIALLEIAKKECDADDKSTEYMFEYMQNIAKVDLDTVLKFLMLKNFKKGQTVVMHTAGEASQYDGKVWKCKDDSYISSGGSEVVFLEDFSGHYDCQFLQKINIEEETNLAYSMGALNGYDKGYDAGLEKGVTALISPTDEFD